MTPRFLMTVFPNEWLSEEILNTYGSVLVEGQRDSYYLTNHWSQQLANRGVDGIAMWKATIELIASIQENEFERVLIPVNIDQNHWILAVLHCREVRFLPRSCFSRCCVDD